MLTFLRGGSCSSSMSDASGRPVQGFESTDDLLVTHRSRRLIRSLGVCPSWRGCSAPAPASLGAGFAGCASLTVADATERREGWMTELGHLEGIEESFTMPLMGANERHRRCWHGTKAPVVGVHMILERRKKYYKTRYTVRCGSSVNSSGPIR